MTGYISSYVHRGFLRERLFLPSYHALPYHCQWCSVHAALKSSRASSEGEADPSALKAISAATGGTSYIAHSADDIKRVFVEALLARRADVINPAQ